ncbi:uncharacterized protein [Sinocyclocheilus grahami]|uniref:uncharacterized protein isoform X2 n=1 Tax=Sinocyclocheilus grahami TaxID=75366 RepID=UPI0007ACC2A1|nr:PREDICTED: uncharacterized protein LOC107574000 isoform X2 [Sinocyclocheilus grahami]
MRNHSFIFWLLFFVHGVFGVDEVKSVSVMVGDSVTLNTDDTEIQGAAKLQWRIQGEKKFIAVIDRETQEISVPGNDEEMFSGRLELINETGSLTITNITTTDSRVYELQIKIGRVTKPRIFNVSVHGVFSSDGVKKMSVRDGDPVTLQTRITDITADDGIQWTLGPQHTSVVKTDRENRRIIYNEHDVRFTDRLHLNIQTGDLTISNTKTEVSGLYQIKIIKHVYTIEKSFSVSVSESDQHTSDPGHDRYYVPLILVSVIFGLVIVIETAFLIYYRKYKQDRQSTRHWVPYQDEQTLCYCW